MGNCRRRHPGNRDRRLSTDLFDCRGRRRAAAGPDDRLDPAVRTSSRSRVRAAMTGNERAIRLATTVAIAAGYLYFFPYFGHLRNPNENVRVYMVLSIVDHHTFALNQTI